MRLKVVFRLKKAEIGVEYRKIFISFLKNSFERTNAKIFEKFYQEESVMKPFTFGVYLPEPEIKDNNITLSSRDITLNFSTYYQELAIYLYNALIKNRFNSYPMANSNELCFVRANIQKEKKITSNEIVFKTLSPFLVRQHDQNHNKDEYLLSAHNDFTDRLKEINRVMFKELIGFEEDIEIVPVKLKKVPVKHYGVILEGNAGIIKLTGKPEALDFIYKVGLGSRRSEGFGLLEVVG